MESDFFEINLSRFKARISDQILYTVLSYICIKVINLKIGLQLTMYITLYNVLVINLSQFQHCVSKVCVFHNEETFYYVQFLTYERGLSFFSLKRARRDTPATCQNKQIKFSLHFSHSLQKTSQHSLQKTSQHTLSGCYLADLEADTGNITDGVTFTTETSNEDFVVFIDEV